MTKKKNVIGLPAEWRYQQPPAITTTLNNNNNNDDDTPATLVSVSSLASLLEQPLAELNMGTYVRSQGVTNCTLEAQPYLDMGLRLYYGFLHELAALFFRAVLEQAPYCAFAHGMVALCHAPNYNFQGRTYYGSTYNQQEDEIMTMTKDDLLYKSFSFPSQVVADRHSRAAMELIQGIQRLHQESDMDDSDSAVQPPLSLSILPDLIRHVECEWLSAIRILTGQPGIDPDRAECTVGRPYAHAMQQLYQQYPHDHDIVYGYVDSLMVLHAWSLYAYPSGIPTTTCPDEVQEINRVLDQALHPPQHEHEESSLEPPQPQQQQQQPPHPHAGLCHLFIHFVEMSANPERANLRACPLLRLPLFCPDAGHLLHMTSHIDVLMGEYERCVESNLRAIQADARVEQCCGPVLAANCRTTSNHMERFYFGYVVHNWHMAVYGCILGGYEGQGLQLAQTFVQDFVNEDLLSQCSDGGERVATYLEAYSALDIHVLVRFGRWHAIVQTLTLPKNRRLMVFRTASLLYARGLAYAALGDLPRAQLEQAELDAHVHTHAELIPSRILHNNTVADILAIDVYMLKGEIWYRQGLYEEAFTAIRHAVLLQDALHYDEPWGQMQPVRHALGGLLLEQHDQGQGQNYVEEAEQVFRDDLQRHPNNPFGLVGLIGCLRKKRADDSGDEEFAQLKRALESSKQCAWSDFEVLVSCACCTGTRPCPESPDGQQGVTIHSAETYNH